MNRPDRSRTRVRREPLSTLIPWRMVAVMALTGLALVLAYRQIDIAAVHVAAQRLDAGVAFVLLTLLPLVGFPVSVLHVAAGIRFGTELGMVLVPISILLQVLASYLLVSLWRERFSRGLARFRRRLPSGAKGPVALFIMLLPGAPFFAQNYLLAVIGVRLRTALLWCYPLHVLRSSIAVIFGGQSRELTPGRVALLGLYWVTLLCVSWWAYRRLRTRFAQADEPIQGQTQPA